MCMRARIIPFKNTRAISSEETFISILLHIYVIAFPLHRNLETENHFGILRGTSRAPNGKRSI